MIYLSFLRASKQLEYGLHSSWVTKLSRILSKKLTSRSECVETLDEKKEEEEIDPDSIRLSLDNFKYVFLLFFMAFLLSFVVFLYEMITKSR